MNDSITAGPSESQEPLAVCDCHAEPVRWHRDPRRKAGGYWRCRIRRRETDRRYDATEKRREARRRYRESDKGRAALDRYLGSATYRRYRMRVAQRRWQEQIQRYEAQMAAWGWETVNDRVLHEVASAALRIAPLSTRAGSTRPQTKTDYSQLFTLRPKQDV